MYQTVKIVVVALAVLALSACSSGKLVKTYEGDALPKEQVASILAPENISLISVNGKRVPKYLLNTINTNYALKPGVNHIVFEYESVWAVASKGKGTDRSEAVNSGPQEVVVEVAAGDALTFKLAPINNVREARALASKFKAEVINGQGKVLATSTKEGVYTPPVETTVAVQAPVLPVVSSGSSPSPIVTRAAPSVSTAQSAPNQSLPPLEGLKVLWNSASADEKKAFLQWAFQ